MTKRDAPRSGDDPRIEARDDDDGSAPLKIDTLRERLAARELSIARGALAKGGVEAVVEVARAQLADADVARSRFEILSRDLELHPSERESLMEAYLRESVRDRRALKADLRAMRKNRLGQLDATALSERIARVVADAERAAEVALALARKAVASTPQEVADVGPIVALARGLGRWSRRNEALGLLGEIARRTAAGADARAEIAAVARDLMVRTEHRWVQPAALATLASVDPEAALALARERLANPEPGDDFLVRERIVELAGRGALGPGAWASLVNFAAGDGSDHVRITAARAERDAQRLARMAAADPSPKVRATALITLAQRDGVTSEASLVAALDRESAGIVVQTAAEELSALARRGRTRERSEVLAALGRAERRASLPAAVRTKVADALLEVVVFSDIVLRAAHDALAPIVADTPVGSHTKILDPILSSLRDDELGRVLAVLSTHDFALGVDRVEGGVILHRGEARSFASWRALFELTHPSPSKRQAFRHTLGRNPLGALRAPPGGLAELTATRVPGERVLSERAGDWGRQLPLVDDLLSTGVVRGKQVALVGATGITTITPPRTLFGRVRAWSRLTFHYAELAELRRRALDSEEPAMQAGYLNEVARTTAMRVRFSPHAFHAGDVAVAGPTPRGLQIRNVTNSLIPSAPSPRPSAISGGPASARTKAAVQPTIPGPSALALPPVLGALHLGDRLHGVSEIWEKLVAYGTSPQGNRLPHLAAYACVVLGAMMIRGVAMRRSIARDREAIPLVIGGWGTRGKSGTERLKAGLFQGLGHECLVKTTGCEAMFIHAIPGAPAREVFIYRPYDKATVWEQRDVLELARRLGVRVFLWECMALQPDLVNMLQSQWMRDDYSTITNAYPDHEDVMGPSGYDVASVISEFIPNEGNLITTEEQMLPLLRERAKERDTNLRVVPARDATLIADDLLARFPYQEHPSNIALVTSLARALGIPAAVAIAEMADHVVPDLGVLKTYPSVPHRDRMLSFTNGMSANERTGALSNWTRTGFDKHDVEEEPARHVVTVVNNRGDRVARSEVFADFIVADIAAHKHVLIGTNVGGLVGYIHRALDRHLASITPVRDLEGDGTERLRTARARVELAFKALKVGRPEPQSVTRELEALSLKAPDAAAIEQMLEPAEPGESYARARAAVEKLLPSGIEGEVRPFVVTSIAKRRTLRAVQAIVSRDLGSAPAAVERAFFSAYREMFEETLVRLDDPTLSGDQVLDAVAKSVPPGATASVMGVQNIKGTGLDFVYRWVSIDTVTRLLRPLASPTASTLEERDAALRQLLFHGEYGLLDARVALDAVLAAHGREPDEKAAEPLPYAAVIARLRTVVAAREKKLGARASKSIIERVRGVFGATFDYLDSTRRRRMAGELLSSLVTGRVSHATAALRMREIVARAKGAWAQRAPA